MTVTTNEYWEVLDLDGTWVTLNTLAYNITSQSGRWTPPDVRGDNFSVPFRKGGVWTPKEPDQRVLNLSMWVQGSDENGVSGNMLTQFRNNWHTLTSLFYRPWEPVPIRKIAMHQNSLRTSASEFSYGGGLDPSFQGQYHAEFEVDLTLHDPFFYDVTSTEVLAIGVGQTKQTTNPAFGVWSRISITFEGPLEVPRLTNESMDPDVWVQYNGSIEDGDSVTINVDEFQVVRSVSGADSPAAGTLSHSGWAHWFVLRPNVNNLRLSANSGTGSAAVSYYPSYI